jgi:hypothetical protein
MKTTTVLVTLIAVLGAGIDSVSATCFSGKPWREFWEDRELARMLAERECRQGAFQGVYAPGQVKSICLPYTTRMSVTFSVQNLNTVASLDLADDECVLRLHNEINLCDRGGQTDVSGWRFL